ncbi:MAG: hypothetical protein LIO77_02575 [Rikenellaceae bacterium]|nr:hypothetical protein [Rikenellaceae bacterium]
MNVVRKYDIAYKGLGEGRHEFGFEMDNEFFPHSTVQKFSVEKLLPG